MSCKICGRSSCTESFHSLADQEECEHGAYKTQCEICELRAELEAVKAERDDFLEVGDTLKQRLREAKAQCDEFESVRDLAMEALDNQDCVMRQIHEVLTGKNDEKIDKFSPVSVVEDAKRIASELASAKVRIKEMRKGEPVAKVVCHPHAELQEAKMAILLLEKYDCVKDGDHLYLAPTLPEGWMAVPIEPTDEMRKLANNAIRRCYPDVKDVWDAMLESAPELSK